MRSRWKRMRYRLEWLGLVLATKLIPLCSRRVCYHIAQTAGALLSFVDRDRYQIALSNLEVAFGGAFSLEQRRKMARESFQHFARTMVDLLWSPRLTQENFFFSSRRRHTRSLCDWSSDVCSSDLRDHRARDPPHVLALSIDAR